MSTPESIQAVRAELATGIGLQKCRQCGCMENALDNLAGVLPSVSAANASALARDIAAWREQMCPIKYACLGCEYCYPAVAHNAFAQVYPNAAQFADASCEFRVQDVSWPPVVGEYFVLDKSAPVAVSTLASVELAAELARVKPNGLAIVGKTETENIGIDKVIKNVVTSSTLRYLIVAGVDPQGHQTGNTLLALAAQGVDENGRVIGSHGKRPILRNVTTAEIQAFREQVQVIDMLGCEKVDEIRARVEELAQQPVSACGCSEEQCRGDPLWSPVRDAWSPVSISAAPKIVASEPGAPVTMDKAGYFVIVPLAEKGIISVEHYAYDNSLLRTIEGANARAIYSTLINEGWVSELSHAAYLGKELAKAELSLRNGFKYVQDGA